MRARARSLRVGLAVAAAWTLFARGASAAEPAPSTTAKPFAPYPPKAPRVVPQPDKGYVYAQPQYRPTLAWWAAQLVPSPEFAIGTYHAIGVDGVAERRSSTSFGLRWQLSPVLYSWGTSRHSTRWRFFVVDPLARNAGSIELDTTFDAFFGHVGRVIVRPGVRATFPVIARGEYLSASIGTSIYAYDDMVRVAYDAGVYTLFGVVGAQITVAPAHAPLATIATLRLRYF